MVAGLPRSRDVRVGASPSSQPLACPSASPSHARNNHDGFICIPLRTCCQVYIHTSVARYRRHAQFSILHDVWYSYEPFHCEEGVSEGEPQFADIYKKVGPWTGMLLASSSNISILAPLVPACTVVTACLPIRTGAPDLNVVGGGQCYWRDPALPHHLLSGQRGAGIAAAGAPASGRPPVRGGGGGQRGGSSKRSRNQRVDQ